MNCKQKNVKKVADWMDLYQGILARTEKISVIGLGYVGLPIAVAFAKLADVIAFDISSEKIASYQNGIDVTNEVGDAALAASTAQFTADAARLRDATFHIIAVPTPIHADKTPNLQALIAASKLLGEQLTRGSIVVYESTVYPGVTENVCIPVLEQASGLVYARDFFAGYSPERSNPSDTVHRLDTVTKIVSGTDSQTTELIAAVYRLVAKAGVYPAESIMVAEAAKVIENSQRDINIAFMNEISMIFHRLGIDTQSVLRAAKTKWNFLDFSPGLVGGHCIGVDPYYLTYLAEQLGYHSQIILSGRKINDDMGRYIAESVVKQLLKSHLSTSQIKVAVLGITFKENCNDCRNTKVLDLISELGEYGIASIVCDPVADPDEVWREHGIHLHDLSEIHQVHCVIVAVAHHAFTSISVEHFQEMFVPESDYNLLVDVKGIYDKNTCENHFIYWRL